LSRKKRNLLILLASAILLSVLILAFRPYDLLDDTELEARTTAQIISIEPVPTLNHRQTATHIAKLSIQLGEGRVATAAALVEQIADCSVGDSVTVRLLATRNADKQL
jgi:hypothetical protein